jgi:putative transposase
MKTSNFSEAQIALMLKQAEDGMAIGEVCRRGIRHAWGSRGWTTSLVRQRPRWPALFRTPHESRLVVPN